jgi:hypothetical protein
MELSGLNLRIKAAHTLYRKVWGKKSDDIFEAVPGRGDYRYLTTQKIVELGLEALSYKAKILLVREEFEIAYKELKDYNKPPNESGWGGRHRPTRNRHALPLADRELLH